MGGGRTGSFSSPCSEEVTTRPISILTAQSPVLRDVEGMTEPGAGRSSYIFLGNCYNLGRRVGSLEENEAQRHAQGNRRFDPALKDYLKWHNQQEGGWS